MLRGFKKPHHNSVRERQHTPTLVHLHTVFFTFAHVCMFSYAAKNRRFKDPADIRIYNATSGSLTYHHVFISYTVYIQEIFYRNNISLSPPNSYTIAVCCVSEVTTRQLERHWRRLSGFWLLWNRAVRSPDIEHYKFCRHGNTLCTHFNST